MKRTHSILQVIYTIPILAFAMSGCVVQHGVDFGHWAKTAERRVLVRTEVSKTFDFTNGCDMVFLPVLPTLPGDASPRLQKQLADNLQDYFPQQLQLVEVDENTLSYFSTRNLMISGSVPNIPELAKAGRVYNTPLVLYMYVSDYNPYPPQKLSWKLWMIHTATTQAILQAEAIFDASEQQTVLALGDHLQSRRARKFDYRNLDVMLQSPTEFSGFTCAYAARHMATQRDKLQAVPQPTPSPKEKKP